MASTTDSTPKQWSISTPRIFDILSPVDRIMIAGCGGGYDIFSGLPLYFNLTAKGKNVVMVNLSFTNLSSMELEKYCDGCYIVKNSTKLPSAYEGKQVYFPEYYLTCWLAEKIKKDVKMYAFERVGGGQGLAQVYKKLVKDLNIGAIVLVDGGTDSLTFGTEEHMGTPVEDHMSMVAVSDTVVPVKLLACLGFGVDAFHGISHGLFLENVAKMEKAGGYYGCFSVSQNSTEGNLFIQAYESVRSKMQPSIVCASVTDSMKGEFGDHHSTPRTKPSKLFINALMNIYWVFDLDIAVGFIPYRAELLTTSSASMVRSLIARYQETVRKNEETRKHLPLPM